MVLCTKSVIGIKRLEAFKFVSKARFTQAETEFLQHVLAIKTSVTDVVLVIAYHCLYLKTKVLNEEKLTMVNHAFKISYVQT